jgi:hypothetical protein
MGKLLFSDGDWTIEELTHGQKYYSVVKHVCYSNGGTDEHPANALHKVVMLPFCNEQCWRCHVKVPEGMVAVWKFQNWEQLKYGG